MSGFIVSLALIDLKSFLGNPSCFPTLSYEFSVAALEYLCAPSDCKSTLSIADVEGSAAVLGSVENQPYLKKHIKSDK